MQRVIAYRKNRGRANLQPRPRLEAAHARPRPVNAGRRANYRALRFRSETLPASSAPVAAGGRGAQVTGRRPPRPGLPRRRRPYPRRAAGSAACRHGGPGSALVPHYGPDAQVAAAAATPSMPRP